jgi:hypothetical protein
MEPIFDDNTAYIKFEKCSCGCYKHCGFSCLTDDCDCNECLCTNCKDNGENLNG